MNPNVLTAVQWSSSLWIQQSKCFDSLNVSWLVFCTVLLHTRAHDGIVIAVISPCYIWC